MLDRIEADRPHSQGVFDGKMQHFGLEAFQQAQEAIDAALDVWPIFEAFQFAYVSKGLLLEQKKNASALSPSGPSAGASATAKRAKRPAKPARRG